MKRRLRFLGMLLLGVFAAFTFTACSSDDDEENGGGIEGIDNIYGTWRLVQEKGYDSEDDYSYNESAPNDCNFLIRFYADGTFVRVEDDDINDNYAWIGPKAPFSLDGNRLYIPVYLDKYMEIKTLNSNTLVLYTEEYDDRLTQTYNKVSDSVIEEYFNE